MYSLSPRFGAVYWNKEKARFLFVFLACLNLPVSLTVPMPVSIYFCFYFSLWVCHCISLSVPFPSFSFTYLSSWGQAPVFRLLQRYYRESRAGSFPESGSLLTEIFSLDFSCLCVKGPYFILQTGSEKLVLLSVLFFLPLKEISWFKGILLIYLFINSFICLYCDSWVLK